MERLAQARFLTLSHWPKSGTPANLKRDTSAATVFAYLDSPSVHVLADIASNNHFDEDGLIGIFALIEPTAAEKYRELLLDAASAGDFGVFKRRDAVRIAFTLGAYADPETSPFPAELFALTYPELAGQLYVRLLELMPNLLRDTPAYRQLWETEDQRLAASEELIEKGRITIEENPALDLAVVRIPEDVTAQPLHAFTQEHLTECHPFALHSRTPCTRLLIIQGQHVEFHYRYESWVQLASRRPPARVDLSSLARELNHEETSGGLWVFEGVERITPRLHLQGTSKSSLSPATIQRRLEESLSCSSSRMESV